MKRGSGVLMHISSLYGDYSCGSFGKSAREFIDFLCESGFSYWQVLPFCIVDECNSPYKSYSAFAGNPYFIDLDVLYRKGLITKEELDESRQKTPYSCEYERLSKERFLLLKKASERVKCRDDIEDFVKANIYVDKFTRYMALKVENAGNTWDKWTCGQVNNDVLFAWKFIQYEFFSQWLEIKKYANSKGIKIIGDIPIYVAYDSSDVWGERDLFLLDEDGKPQAVAGVPPDYFAEDGQLWGNPLYDWDKMKKDGYRWWMHRMEHMLKMFDGVRIDHFRALESYYSITYGEKTAKNGVWVKGPGREFIDKLKSVSGDSLIIAEDLGDITHEVYELVKYSGFPGMRVFQFAFLSDDNIHRPHNYENNCVAYTGTHDNNTLLGYVWELDADTRRTMLSYCGYEHEDWDNGYENIIKTMLGSSAGLVIIPIQDLLGYGSDTRLNTPGKPDGNWSYRITKEQLDTIDRGKYRYLNKIYGRIQ